jgi:uncharacterized membrane protein
MTEGIWGYENGLLFYNSSNGFAVLNGAHFKALSYQVTVP